MNSFMLKWPDIFIELDKDFGKLDIEDVDGGLWLPFLSLRFWTFGLVCYGLTGILLHALVLHHYQTPYHAYLNPQIWGSPLELLSSAQPHLHAQHTQ